MSSSSAAAAPGPLPDRPSSALASIINVVIAVLLGFFTYEQGLKGVYLFDTGISALMGWLIHNGWTPFHDFQSPLPFLSGSLVSIGYSLFGISYRSGVIVASLLMTGGYLLVFSQLRHILSWGLASLVAVAATLATLPLINYPYYNHVAYLGATIFSACTLRHLIRFARPLGQSASFSAARIYLIAVVVALVKLQVGGLLFIAFAAVELIALCLRAPASEGEQVANNTLSVPGAVGVRLLVPILITTATLGWLHFRLHEIAFNLFGITTKAYVRSNFAAHKTAYLSEHLGIFAQPAFNQCALVLMVLSTIIGFGKRSLGNQTALRLLLFGVFLMFAQLMLAVTTAEALAVDIATEVMVLVALGLAIQSLDAPSGRTAWIYTIPILLFFTLFSFNYARERTRLSWSETQSAFDPELVLRDQITPSAPYFQQIKVRPDQNNVLDYIYTLHTQNPSATIYFGGELETMYPMTGQFPPRGWPLWLHTEVSVIESQFPKLRVLFAQSHYDLIVLSKNRRWMTTFIDPVIAAYYDEVPLPKSAWIQVYQQKGAQIALPVFSPAN